MKNADKPINPVLTQSPSLQNDTSLGLTKREQIVQKEDNPQIRGMINVVKHLITVEEA